MRQAILGIAALALAAALGNGTARAADPYDIHVVLPLTGGGSFIGLKTKANFEALEALVNQEGGVQGRPVHFVFADDQSSPQRAVQVTNEILESKPPVVLGSAVVGMCNAMAPLMAKGPVQYCLSPSFKAPAGGYGFSAAPASDDQVAALIRYFRLKGWTKLAVLNSIDATGQNADVSIEKALAMPENKDVKLVTHQHFNPTDVSVAAQMEQIKAAGADSMIAWTTGAQVATIFKAMIQADVDIPIGTSSGNQISAQLDQYLAFLPKHLFIGSAIHPEHEGVLTLDPQVEAVQHKMYAALATHDLHADIATAASWDAGLIVVDALRKFGTGASAEQIRDHILGLTNFAGIDGIYNFKEHPDRGIGPESSTVVTYDPDKKRWVWLSKPGGTPLP
jgi:branched-chain amino acid transport system substrate-binding protein